MKQDAQSLRAMKAATPIPMLTAYTTPMGRCLERAGIPVILVGDTVGMVEMGFESTRAVTVDMMEYHIGAVRRGAPGTHIVGDLPYGSAGDPEQALRNAQRLITAGADSVKVEGPQYDTISHLITKSVDVVGHTGLTPQTAADFSQVGRSEYDANRILEEAQVIESSGAYIMILEHIPDELGAQVTAAVGIPTVGIGAGPHCDGKFSCLTMRLGWVTSGRPSPVNIHTWGKWLQRQRQGLCRTYIRGNSERRSYAQEWCIAIGLRRRSGGHWCRRIERCHR